MKEKELLENGYKKYQGDGIDVYWKPDECCGAGMCHTGSIEIFCPTRRPWIILDGHDADKIAETVDSCPTDALLYIRK